MKLSVVIVNYNVRHFLWQCLDSVQRASAGLNVEVFVVDNASTDASIDYVRTSFPNVRYIQNTENVGFARANNLAIRQSSGNLVLLLNPDTIVAEETFADCLHFFENHPRAGALGIHMLNRDGSFARESRRGLPTPATSFYKLTGLCHLYPAHPRFGRYYMGHLPEYEEGQIEVISGAFMMLRREALEQVGYLDEGYFMYGEDIDLSYRIGSSGWECWYSPSLMLHYKGESTQNTSFRYVHSFYNAMLIFFRKHFARKYWFSWLLVEIAVVMMGIISYIRNWTRRGLNVLHEWFCPSSQRIGKLCFIGSDAGWSLIQSICSRAGLTPKRISDLSDVDKDTIILAFEIGTCSYHDILSTMSNASAQALKADVGTLNLKTQTLILPNDIFCS